jgi:hypothetical protein
MWVCLKIQGNPQKIDGLEHHFPHLPYFQTRLGMYQRIDVWRKGNMIISYNFTNQSERLLPTKYSVSIIMIIDDGICFLFNIMEIYLGSNFDPHIPSTLWKFRHGVDYHGIMMGITLW